MRASFEQIIEGLNRYIDREIYPGLNDLQEMLARIVVGRFNEKAESVKEWMMGNGFVKTLGIIDSDGMVDIDGILHDLRREIERKNGMTVDVPLIGKITFHASDVDAVRDEISRR